MLSGFLCLLVIRFTYACGDELGSKSSLFMEQLFPPLHWTMDIELFQNSDFVQTTITRSFKAIRLVNSGVIQTEAGKVLMPTFF